MLRNTFPDTQDSTSSVLARLKSIQTDDENNTTVMTSDNIQIIDDYTFISVSPHLKQEDKECQTDFETTSVSSSTITTTLPPSHSIEDNPSIPEADNTPSAAVLGLTYDRFLFRYSYYSGVGLGTLFGKLGGAALQKKLPALIQLSCSSFLAAEYVLFMCNIARNEEYNLNRTQINSLLLTSVGTALTTNLLEILLVDTVGWWAPPLIMVGIKTLYDSAQAYIPDMRQRLSNGFTYYRDNIYNWWNRETRNEGNNNRDELDLEEGQNLLHSH